MIRVTVELLPGGFESRPENLGTLLIVNDGTGGSTVGHYDARTYRKRGRLGTFTGRRLWWHVKPTRTARVENYARLSRPVWDLVASALGALGYASVKPGTVTLPVVEPEPLPGCTHESLEAHACPYAQEINGDDDECTCCEACERDCARDI